MAADTEIPALASGTSALYRAPAHSSPGRAIPVERVERIAGARHEDSADGCGMPTAVRGDEPPAQRARAMAADAEIPALASGASALYRAPAHSSPGRAIPVERVERIAGTRHEDSAEDSAVLRARLRRMDSPRSSSR